METSMGKLQIEYRRQQEEIGEDPKKEESPLALPPPQQVQGESSQDLLKDWKFVINHPQYQSIGELNFFLGLQIKQLKEGTFINQAKFIKDLLKRFNMEEAKTIKTLMISSIKLDKNEKPVPFFFDFLMAPRRETTSFRAQASALLSHLNLLRRRLAERQGSTRPSSALWRIIRGTSRSSLRGSDYFEAKFFDISEGILFAGDIRTWWTVPPLEVLNPVGPGKHLPHFRHYSSWTQVLRRMKFEKAPMAPGLGELSDNQHRLGDRDRPSSQPFFTEPTHTKPSPHQAPHALDHAPWMDLSTQISSLGTRMEEFVVSDTRFYSMEDHMD
ncbi:hypothetical protein CK203_111726 [Vitis vinifera]|uniref:Reverse transcriptase Ty1/copia-type domain-containing protein n=1 Tax=Vitis vinifera TaxID=29760 RepID=A0A438FF99_VITVI|nr:hypothetical protein CK203_111726 [Vitis vinifera]